MAEPQPFVREAEEIWRRAVAREGRDSAAGIIRRLSENGRGEISVNDGKSWKPATAGMHFPRNAIIRTDGQTSLDFSFRENGAQFRIGPGSWIRIVRMEIENTGIEKITEDMLEMERGKLTGAVPRLTPASMFLIRTERAVIQPYGKFEIDAEGFVVAEGGRVYADGTSYSIPNGTKFSF